MSITPQATRPPARLGVPCQIVLSRGLDPTDPARALWRIGARFQVEDADGGLVEVPLALVSPDPDGSGATDSATYLPHRGDEVNVYVLLTPAQRTQARAFLTTVEAALATALGVTPGAARLTGNGWQRPGR